jgi:hypothetical protein
LLSLGVNFLSGTNVDTCGEKDHNPA